MSKFDFPSQTLINPKSYLFLHVFSTLRAYISAGLTAIIKQVGHSLFRIKSWLGGSGGPAALGPLRRFTKEIKRIVKICIFCKCLTLNGYISVGLTAIIKQVVHPLISMKSWMGGKGGIGRPKPPCGVLKKIIFLA